MTQNNFNNANRSSMGVVQGVYAPMNNKGTGVVQAVLPNNNKKYNPDNYWSSPIKPMMVGNVSM